MMPLLVCPSLLTVSLLAALPMDLAPSAKASASTSAGGKYVPPAALDGDLQTRWACAADAPLPQTLTLTWPQPQRFDTVQVTGAWVSEPSIYAAWQACEVEAGGQVVASRVDDTSTEAQVLRFTAPVTADSLVIRISAVVEPRTYVGIREVRVYLDPQRQVQLPPSTPHPRPLASLTPKRRAEYPCVYNTPADVARARRNAKETAWGRRVADGVVKSADRWLARSEAEWRRFLPAPGACYAYGFTGSPKSGASWGTWGGARCSWDEPGRVRSGDGLVLPNEQYPDGGTGYRGPDGRVHYFVGSWNAWVTEQWTDAIDQLADAYAVTGDERYADRAACFLDLLASIYPESSAGSWDYPSKPPSGRFARPWYQVARTLVRYVEAYDLIYASGVLDKPSARPALEQTWPAGPRAQQTAVGTADRRGVTRPGLTRRQNIDLNLVLDGGYYCYEHTFSGMLHNGHADYMRGALAAGALLGIPAMVRNAIDSPYSFWAMVANNCDRDGRYYETSLMYSLHARSLYLTFVAPLLNWRDEQYPRGVELLADARFRSYYRLPSLVFRSAGHETNYGDTGPNTGQIRPPSHPFDRGDYAMAEEVYAGTTGAAKEEFAAILRWLGKGHIERLRETSAGRWNLYHSDPIAAGPAALPPDLHRQVFASWFLGQKGMAFLRDGAGGDQQVAFLRWGPSLNHGHLDDLGLIYYAKGWQCTYDIGYGLGSTHTQVGWARQTVSHAMVTVNEHPQSGPGSGGSLHLFARLPGLKLIEADSPLSYGREGVSLYRRTVALVGEGRDQVLVDLFRVAGGRQHDYVIGAQGEQPTVTGVTLGTAGDGSLAAGGESWGRRLGHDGDVIGQPNKPYWNPPPGNGYGFFWAPQRAPAGQPFVVDWPLGGGNDAHFQVHCLPEADSEAIVAKAPGLYRNQPNASYALVRRRGADGLRSTFAAVAAPYARPPEAGVFGPAELAERVLENDAQTILGSGFGPGYLLLKGQPGQQATFGLEVAEAGDYDVRLDCLLYPSYGRIQLSLDGTRLGQPLNLQAGEAKPLTRFELGRHHLTAGPHRLRVQLVDRTLAGLQRLSLQRAGTATPVASPVVTAAQRLAVTGDAAAVPAAVRYRRGDADELLLSAIGEADCRVTTPQGEVRWRGGTAWLSFSGGQLAAVALAGCAGLTAGDVTITPETGAYSGRVTGVDADRNTVDLDVPLTGANLLGEAAIFSRREWNRTSGYHIVAVEPRGQGCRLHFGAQSLLLGQGRVMAITDDHTVVSDIPHDYVRSVVDQHSSGFFTGKRVISSSGAETRLREVAFGQPMPLQVDSVNGLRANDVLRYIDLGPGDQVRIPTTVWARRGADGQWQVQSTVPVRLGQTAFAATGLDRPAR